MNLWTNIKILNAKKIIIMMLKSLVFQTLTILLHILIKVSFYYYLPIFYHNMINVPAFLVWEGVMQEISGY